ncbi:uncharacterized protein [Temnothorax longispinosus]|uniref:uncharacterized protein isoform X2 n=1 Tax=Temnothorax longispinosus TaxID=300112 RepID=UPI003A99DDEC
MSGIKLNDRECVLVQFINERKTPVQVGFQAWLKDKENMDFANIVDTEVIIRWPVKIEIRCAKTMTRVLQNHDRWKDLVVKVRAVGEWTVMCQQANNIQKYGVANPSKEQRRVLCHKNPVDDQDTSDSSLEIDELSSDLTDLAKNVSDDNITKKKKKKTVNDTTSHQHKKQRQPALKKTNTSLISCPV